MTIQGQEPEYATINGVKLAAPRDHIYLREDLPPTYDRGPWSYIHSKASGYQCELDLVDIGSNIGDSVVYYRGISGGEAICVEASDLFCEYFKFNSKYLGKTRLIHALAIPDVGNEVGSGDSASHAFKFVSGGQTGFTEVSSDGEDVYGGRTIYISQLLKLPRRPFIFKSDTDGFDHFILGSLVDAIVASGTKDAKIVFIEGPSYDQMIGDAEVVNSYICSARVLTSLGYKVTLFSNHGSIFAECGFSVESMHSCFKGFRESARIGRAYCHYFDLIFYL